ncbi:MAG: M14 family metallopeptidase [Bryobacteraceae bacterium]|nr:M14 family metallopeptidase [Bryobacteraceae bacterium]
MPPASLAETPAMRAARSLAESTAAAAPRWRTHAEKTDFRETGSYGEAVGFYSRLAAASPFARLAEIGRSSEGRPISLFVASRDRAFTPQAARRSGKPVVLLQNGIHPGENGGKDAAMMLLRDVLVTRRLAHLLDSVIILSIPVFNPDGHERVSPWNRINENGPAQMGFRVTARRLNLNRDYMKADTPEMRAWLRMYNAWLPDLLIDNHVTDGGDTQYDATFAAHTGQDIAPPVGRWVKEQFLPELFRRLESLGHVPGFYIEGRAAGGKALAAMNATPRYSTGYAAAQNRAALLVETHSLKSFRTRAWAHYDVMQAALEIAAAQGSALRRASGEADRMQAAVRPGEAVFLEGAPSGEGEPYTLRGLRTEQVSSPVSGGMVIRYAAERLDTPARIVRTLEPRVAPPAPHGYAVPREWSEIIELLRLHGVEMIPLARPVEGEFDTVRFEDVKFAVAPFEGRFRVAGFRARPVRVRRILPAGSVYVPVAQRAGRAAMHLLEPEAPDSALRWGFFLPIFEQKEYFSDFVFEPFARKMLEADPQLKREFEEKIAADASFAGNPRARLLWLYQRSPYHEPDKDVYPVLRFAAPPAWLPAPGGR